MLKRYENQYNCLMNQQFSLDQVQFAQETIQNTIDTSAVLKQAVGVKKDMMKNININELEDLQDQMAEMVEDTQEIQDIMSRDYAIGEMDQGELDAELDALDEAVVNEKFGEGEKAPSYLPEAAKANVKNAEEELKDLMN